MSSDGQREQEHFFGAAKRVAGLTMLSRILGLVRDMVLVPLGGPRVADAFWLAFSVPHYFRRLFGEGALSAAFVPVFTETAEKHGWDRARRVLGNTAGLLALVLAALVVLIELGLLASLLLAPGPWHRQLTLQLTMLMLPFMFGICMLALCSAALNSRGHFTYPAAAPILLNVGMILAGAWLAPVLGRSEGEQFVVVGIAVVACSVVQLLGAIWLLRRTQLAARWTLRPVLPEIRQIAARMAPTVIPLSMVQLSDLAGRVIAITFTATGADPTTQPYLPLLPGVVRCHHVAGRLYQFPMGVLGISIATVVFPLFSRCAARDDRAGMREALNRALRLCFFLGIPAGVGLIVLAQPAVAVIFQRGGFRAIDTGRAAAMLQMYCLAMPAYFCVHILLRAFFARKETRTPMILSAILAGANVLLVLGGIFTPLRSRALGLATAITSAVNAIVLAWVLRRRLGRLGLRTVAASTLRVAGATAAMAAVVAAVRWPLAPAFDHAAAWLGRPGAAQLLLVVAGVAAGGAVFLLAARLLRCEELRILGRGLRKKSQGRSDTMD